MKGGGGGTWLATFNTMAVFWQMKNTLCTSKCYFVFKEITHVYILYSVTSEMTYMVMH